MPRPRPRRSRPAGYKFLIDQNAEFEDGYFPITISNVYERRVSAAIGYLDPGTRMRENLTISTDTQVSTLLFDGHALRRREGAWSADARRSSAAARSSCRRGAIHSPAHLLRAGIGPAAHLRDMGIEVRANVPGVGQRLQDHPAVAVAAFIKPHARIIQRLHAAAHLSGAALFVEAATAFRPATCSPW